MIIFKNKFKLLKKKKAFNKLIVYKAQIPIYIQIKKKTLRKIQRH